MAGRLAAAGCVAPEEEASEILAFAAGDAVVEEWIGRREHGEPLAWIVGSVEFCGLRIAVDPGVYVPRRQSEELALRAAELLPPGGRAVDLCTGAGAVGAVLTRRRPGVRVVGVDIDHRAAACARRNGVPAVVGDLDAPLRGQHRVDVVTAVAPYVPTGELCFLPADVQRHEPRRALDGGGDGLEVVEAVIGAAARLLRPGGSVLVEIGADQDSGLAPVLGRLGFTGLESWHDEDGDLRGAAAHLAVSP